MQLPEAVREDKRLLQRLVPHAPAAQVHRIGRAGIKNLDEFIGIFRADGIEHDLGKPHLC